MLHVIKIMFLIKFQEYFEKMYSCSGALSKYFKLITLNVTPPNVNLRPGLLKIKAFCKEWTVTQVPLRQLRSSRPEVFC